MMIKGDNPENIKVGSTLATDSFQGNHFDFMLSNPPYGKSWSKDQAYIKDGNEVIDSRFKVTLPDYWGNEETLDATPRSSDGQLLFLMEMVNKMKSPKTTKSAAVLPLCITAQACLLAMQVQEKATSVAILLKTICWRPSYSCLTTCSTTQALPPIFGCCPTINLKHAKAKFS